MFLSITYPLLSQEIDDQDEVGLVFKNLDNFGLTYRTGKFTSLWRFNTLLLNGGKIDESSDSLVNNQNSNGFGLKIGREYRTDLYTNLELRYGADLSFSYSQYKLEYDDKTSNNHDRLEEETLYSPGFNFVLGVNYYLSNDVIIGVEALPNFTYNSGSRIEKNYYSNNGDEIEYEISGFNYGLSNTSALLSLAYVY